MKLVLMQMDTALAGSLNPKITAWWIIIIHMRMPWE
jgi:hypothetical protein